MDAQWPKAFEQAIISMLPDTSDGQPIAPGTDLISLGLTSLGRTGLVLLLQDEWDVEFPDEVLIARNFETAGSLWTALAPFYSGD